MTRSGTFARDDALIGHGGSELALSLGAFLRHRRSWQRTATALNVQKQTVMYRMQRVEQLTGRTLAETEDLTDLWLALQARALLSGAASRGRGPRPAPIG